MSSSGHLRSFHPHRFTIVLVGIAACFIVAYFSVVGRRGASADDAPPLSKEEAIAEVERLGGKVRIDGERDDQPVWAVELQEAKIRNNDLRVLASFPMLEVLNLSETPIDDDGLTHVAACKRLNELNLSGTKITDRGLSRLAKLSELTTLELNQTAVTDGGLLQLASLKKLQPPSVFETKVTDAGLQRLSNAQRSPNPPKDISEKPTAVNSQGSVLTSREWPLAPKGVARGSTLPQPKPLPAELLDRLQDRPRESIAKDYHAIGAAVFRSKGSSVAQRAAAIDLLERAVIHDPTCSAYKVDLADVYVLTGNATSVGMAIDLYEEVLRDEPDDDGVLGRLALAYLQMSNDDMAFKTLARRVAGKNVDARATALQIAATAVESRDCTRAVEELRKLAENQPGDPFVQLILAMLLSDAGHREESDELADQIIDGRQVRDALTDAARELKERNRR